MTTSKIITIEELLKYQSNYVRELCKQCKRYDKSSSCPPNIPGLETFKHLINSKSLAHIFIVEFPITNPSKWKELGRESSLELAYVLNQHAEAYAIAGKTPLIFGAGACKNCTECIIPCRYPNKKLISIEAIGINVIRLIYDNFGIVLHFPVKNYFYRVGAILI